MAIRKNTTLRITVATLCGMLSGLHAAGAEPPRDEPAAEKPVGITPYHAVGAPADPRVAAEWNRYRDYAEATKLLKAMAAAHPKLARLKSLGRSYGGREMWVLTVTNFERGNDRTKPALYMGGAIHANEIQATEVALYTAWYLLEMHGHNDFITELVDRRAFYFVPMLSPDSRDAHFHRPNTTHSPRSGQRPVDDDRDGLVDEDGPDDLDGDGHIAQMRIRDPNGRHKPHPKYPNLMIEADPEERGEYRLLGREGFDNDGDGKVNEDGDGYYDPNRDWPWQWQPEYVQRGAHRYPLSIPENRMVADFVMDHANIAAGFCLHNSGGMILRSPCVKDDHMEPDDVATMDTLAKRGERILPGYRALVTSTGLYEAHGVEKDWLYRMRGVLCWTMELFTPHNFFHEKGGRDFFASGEMREEFAKYLLFGEGTIPWHEVDHPQYGKVEVGGYTKNWGRQPPSFMLQEELHRNMSFALYHADQMPQVEVQSARVKPFGEALFEVTATIANLKLTPTHTAADRQHKITPPDLATIEGKDVKVVAGLVSKDQFFTDAKPQKQRPERLEIDNVPGMGAVYVRWLIEGEGPYTVTIRSCKGGLDKRRVPVAE